MAKLKLIEWRRAKGFSQETMADAVGMSRSGYRLMEKNPESCKMGVAKRICEVLDVDIQDIIFLP